MSSEEMGEQNMETHDPVHLPFNLEKYNVIYNNDFNE